MKTNFEKNIKEQLKDRELPVSENAWEKLSEMMDKDLVSQKGMGESSFSKRKLWIPVSIAASVLLVFGLIFMNQKNEEDFQPINPVEIAVEKPVEFKELPVEIEDIQFKIEEKEFQNSNSSTSIAKKTIVPEKVIENHNSIENQIPQKEEIKIEQKVNPEVIESNIELVNNSSTKEKPDVKANYVDPEMLLYSIEHNQAVKQSNSDSRMVIIDFNKVK